MRNFFVWIKRCYLVCGFPPDNIEQRLTRDHAAFFRPSLNFCTTRIYILLKCWQMLATQVLGYWILFIYFTNSDCVRNGVTTYCRYCNIIVLTIYKQANSDAQKILVCTNFADPANLKTCQHWHCWLCPEYGSGSGCRSHYCLGLVTVMSNVAMELVMVVAMVAMVLVMAMVMLTLVNKCSWFWTGPWPWPAVCISYLGDSLHAPNTKWLFRTFAWWRCPPFCDYVEHVLFWKRK